MAVIIFFLVSQTHLRFDLEWGCKVHGTNDMDLKFKVYFVEPPQI
jgi:hypothetical protein